MILQTNKNLRILNNTERIHKRDLVYGKTTKGDIEWCKPGVLKGTKWFKYDPFSPNIVMRKTGDGV